MKLKINYSIVLLILALLILNPVSTKAVDLNSINEANQKETSIRRAGPSYYKKMLE